VSRSAQEIQDWIVARISGLTGVEPEDINVREPYLRYGLDSIAMVALAADLETWLGYRFRSNPLEDHPTIASLAAYLAAEASKHEFPV
jgi:acyl carrier protein